LPVAKYPSAAPPQIAFNVTYPGASAQVIEDTVVKLIEQEMNDRHLLYMEAASNWAHAALTFGQAPTSASPRWKPRTAKRASATPGRRGGSGCH
jgi:hypothetical protein